MKLKDGYTGKKIFSEMQSYIEKVMTINKLSTESIEVTVFDEVHVINKKDLYSKVCQMINFYVEQLENKYAWALFGIDDKSNVECLQVASSNNVSKEIKCDVKAMVAEPFDKFYLDTYFYENVFETYQCRYSNPLYNDMFKKYMQLTFYTIEVDKYLSEKEKKFCLELLGNTDSSVERKYANYAEVKFAYETQAIYWNPFGIEYKILEQIKGN